MPSSLTHAIAGAALAATVLPPRAPARYVAVAAAIATLPDLDILSGLSGLPEDGLFGHRGLTHSILCALLLATTVTLALRRRDGPVVSGSQWRLWLALALAAASHGVLDACTDAGTGVALLAPFDLTRYFLDWRFISGPRLAEQTVWEVLLVRVSEIPVIWVPGGLLLGIWWMRKRKQKRT